MKHVVLTGATGFLGSHLLRALLRQNYRVTILKQSTSNTRRINSILNRVTALDVDHYHLEDAFASSQVDAVIHTACSYGRQNESSHEIANTNLLFSLRLLDAANSFRADTFLNTDTFWPRYLNSYSLSKKQFVEWLKYHSPRTRIINLKLQHVYGPHDNPTKFVPWIISQLDENVARIPLTKGTQMRDFIYIDDVVTAYLVALEQRGALESFSEFDVGTGRLTSLKDFVLKVFQEMSARNRSLNTQLGFGDLSFPPGEIMRVKVNNSSLVNLGWTHIYSVEEGVSKLVALGQ